MKTFIVGALIALAACGDNDGGGGAPEVDGATLTTTEDTPVTHAVVASDPDGDAITLKFDAPEHGDVVASQLSVTYTPDPDYNGPDSFTVTISDGELETEARIDVTVGPVNDAPLATGDAFPASEDVALVKTEAELLVNDVDVDEDALTVTAVSSATNGTVALLGGMITFTPAPDFNGDATFQYTISDGTATSTATVEIAVGTANDAPVAVDDTGDVLEDGEFEIAAALLVANDDDAESQPLTISSVDHATNGTVTLAGGTVTFIPNANFNGVATFEYTVTDGTAADIGVVTVSVAAVNDAPVANDDAVSTNEDAVLALPIANLTANDVDVDLQTLDITIVGGATGGTVAVAAGVVTFTPAANFNGAGSFQYTVSDGTALDTAVVAVTVNAVNDAPVAVNDVATVQADTPLILAHVALLANDTDIDGPSQAITAVGNAVNGTVTSNGTDITFTPNGGFVGEASFDYTLSDGATPTPGTDTGTVIVTVTPGPVLICGDGDVVSPEACDDGNTAPGDGCNANCAVEPGWNCTGDPSDCNEICGDGTVVGGEACDDGDDDDTDGCTTACVVGAICDATAQPGAASFAVDPLTGHCYASFDGEQTDFANARAACENGGGYLATISSAGENTTVLAAHNAAETPWLGATEDANDTDAIFAWVTGEAFGFANFATGQPDDDTTTGGDCLHVANAAGQWADTSCASTTVVGRICEFEAEPCGDGVRQPSANEECDDGNLVDGDGCTATCQTEEGCGDGNLDTGEQCDDGNVRGGDGCSDTCQEERIATFSFTGAAGNEVTLPADGTAPAPGLASIPVISRGVGVDPSGAANAFSANAWPLAGTPGIDLDSYFAFTITPEASFTASLFALELDEMRSGTGIRDWVVRSSLDSFATDIQAFAVPDNTTFRTNQRITLGPAFLNLAAPIEFRIYGFTAEANAGTWRLDNIEIIGFTKPAP